MSELAQFVIGFAIAFPIGALLGWALAKLAMRYG